MICPTCSTEMRALDVPRGLALGVCLTCSSLAQQLADGSIRPIDDALDAHAMGDDRLRMAMSKPRVATLANLIDVFGLSMRSAHFELTVMEDKLKEICVQIENRLDFGIQELSGQALVSDKAIEALTALREARDLVSTLPAKERGVRKDGS